MFKGLQLILSIFMLFSIGILINIGYSFSWHPKIIIVLGLAVAYAAGLFDGAIGLRG